MSELQAVEIDRIQRSIAGSRQEIRNIQRRIMRLRQSFHGPYNGPEWDSYMAALAPLERALEDYRGYLSSDLATLREIA